MFPPLWFGRGAQEPPQRLSEFLRAAFLSVSRCLNPSFELPNSWLPTKPHITRFKRKEWVSDTQSYYILALKSQQILRHHVAFESRHFCTTLMDNGQFQDQREEEPSIQLSLEYSPEPESSSTHPNLAEMFQP